MSHELAGRRSRRLPALLNVVFSEKAEGLQLAQGDSSSDVRCEGTRLRRVNPHSRTSHNLEPSFSETRPGVSRRRLTAVGAIRLFRANREALTACGRKTNKGSASVRCTINVEPSI